jgi:thioester reductase-like protein
VSGATLVVPAGLIAPADLPGYLNEQRITVVDLTPAYWHRMLASVEPDDQRLRTIRLMITGGDVASPGDCAAALAAAPRARMLNAYGLTETAITSTLFEISGHQSAADPPNRVPVGEPLPHARVFVVDGEVYIGGPALAREYLGQPGLTAERFLTGPDGMRMFRTGDLGRFRADGNLELTGRVDRQLKIRGFRVEPAEIESVLAAHPAVDQVRVVADDLAPGDKRLTAYYTARTHPADLDSFAKARLPGYMVPSAYLPLDRELDPKKDSSGERYTPTQAGMSHLWARLLRTERVGLDDDFFGLGGNSLLAAELLARVRVMFGVGVNYVRPLTRALLRDPTLRGFSAATEDARAGRLGTGDAATDIDFAREAALDVPVHPPVITARMITARNGVVLLTGGTGFVGIHLLRELLASTSSRVYCLVRAHDAEHAARRITEAASRYEVGDLEMERVVMVPGDLAEPEFGLSAAEFDELARTVDVVYHAGATVNFIYPYEELRAVNVGGTREVIRLAGRHRGIPVHYVSSAAVLAGLGVAGVRAVTEDQPLGYPDRLCVGYVQSKYVAEELLRNAARSGLPVSIYRPMDVVGGTRTAAWNANAEMRSLIRFIADTGAAPDIPLPLDFVPADTFAAALVHISLDHNGGTFHLTAPRYVRLGFLIERLRRYGYQITEMPYQAWVHELLRFAASDPSHPMTPFVPLFVDHCPGTDLTIAEMYTDDVFPAYSASNAERALRGSGVAFAEVDEELIDTHIEHMIATGFLTDGR